MEEWEVELITRNRSNLIRNTFCNTVLLAMLQELGIFSDIDVAALNKYSGDRMVLASHFYDLIQTKSGGYQILLKGLGETNQTGAVAILTKNPLNYNNSFRFDETKRLGKGSFSSVYKGEFGGKHVVVKKMFNTNDRERNRIENEIKMLEVCKNHDNIVQRLTTKIGGCFTLIVLELCDTTLKKWVADNTKVHISRREIMKNVTQGLEWLHNQRIVYVNLKPENILLKGWPRCSAKICGFGLSTRLEDGEVGAVLSLPPVAVYETQGWGAPEVKPRANRHQKYTFASDVYSLGCMYCYVITNGRYNVGELAELEGIETHNLDETAKIMAKKCRVIQVMKHMISDDSKSRPSCSQLLSLPVLQAYNDEVEMGNSDDLNHNHEPLIVELMNKLRKHKAEQRDAMFKIVDDLNRLDLTLKENEERLFQLVQFQDLCIIKHVLQFAATKVNIREVCREEEVARLGRVKISLLHVAVMYRGYDVLKYLLNEQGFGNVLDKPIFQNTLVIYCIQDIYRVDAEKFKEKCKILECLFNKNPTLIESRGEWKRTPFHLATSWKFSNGKQVEFIKTLLRANASVIAKDSNAYTPLHSAVYFNPPENVMEIIHLLIEHDADPDLKDNGGWTFLHYAAQRVPPRIFQEIIVYFISIERTNSFNIRDNIGQTVLHNAVRYMKGDPLEETLQLLKTHGVNFNALANNGDSIIFLAIERGRNESFLNTLIEFGADWTIKNENNTTALHYAAYYNNMSALTMFIRLKCDVNAKNVYGYTPLHHAINGDPRNKPSHDIINELLLNDADLNLKNNKGESPIDLAKQELKATRMEQRTYDLLCSLKSAKT